MSQEKKWEAVTYWNDVAVQFQQIVATTVGATTASSTSNNACDETPPITDSVSPNGKSIISTKENEILETHPCIVSQQSPTIADGRAATIIEYIESDSGTEVVVPVAATTTTPPTLMATSVSDVEVSATTNTTVSRHLVHGDIPLEASVEYDNRILSDSLGCTRTTADVADEIGNGQFDRGPTREAGGAVLPATTSTYVPTSTSSTLAAPIIHHNNSHHTLFPSGTIPSITSGTSVHTTSSGSCSSTPAIMIPVYHRDHVDSYTHSDRPLQQIQPFEPSIGSNHHQELFFHSNHNNQNRMRAICYNNNNYVPDHQHQHLSMHYATSQMDNNGSFGSVFSSSDTLGPIENCSTMDMEQIVDIKRELIVDSERDDTTVSNGSTNSNSNISSLGSTCIGGNNQQQHSCDVCGKSGFSTKGNLKRHLKAHSGEKPFKCDYCDSCFTEKKSLKIHVRRHTGEKPYKCHVCGKLFSQTGVLQSHMALHLNERKFECQKCGKAFRQRSQLKLHLMRHDGVKRLECQTCNAKFLTKGDLERHCRIHTGERPYRCELCSKTFTRQQSLNEHMNRHTGKKPYYCKFCDKTFSEMSACYKVSS